LLLPFLRDQVLAGDGDAGSMDAPLSLPASVCIAVSLLFSAISDSFFAKVNKEQLAQVLTYVAFHAAAGRSDKAR